MTMETPHIMYSPLRQANLTAPMLYQSVDYRDATQVDLATGSSLPVFNHAIQFPAFAGTGIYLVVVHLKLIESTRTQSSGIEPQQINKLNAVLMGSDGTDVTRDGQPYGAWPAEVIHECEAHEHTVTGGTTLTSIQGVDTGAGVIGGSRRWQVDQQVFLVVDARRGDRLFIFRDYVPYTALSYEMIRLSPALMRYGAIEI
jgi:hypothetical protein